MRFTTNRRWSYAVVWCFWFLVLLTVAWHGGPPVDRVDAAGDYADRSGRGLAGRAVARHPSDAAGVPAHRLGRPWGSVAAGWRHASADAGNPFYRHITRGGGCHSASGRGGDSSSEFTRLISTKETSHG